jgi:hypothetical protein
MQTNHIKSIGTIIILGIITIIIAVVVSMVKQPSQEVPVQGVDPLGEFLQETHQSNQTLSLDNLIENQTVSLPMTITGTVQGWFFEGSFPVFLKDNNGNQLAVVLASSPVDWMTADPIAFTVTLPSVTYTGPGTITFQKDNPSGEPQFDEELVVNVVF